MNAYGVSRRYRIYGQNDTRIVRLIVSRIKSYGMQIKTCGSRISYVSPHSNTRALCYDRKSTSVWPCVDCDTRYYCKLVVGLLFLIACQYRGAQEDATEGETTCSVPSLQDVCLCNKHSRGNSLCSECKDPTKWGYGCDLDCSEQCGAAGCDMSGYCRHESGVYFNVCHRIGVLLHADFVAYLQ